MATDYYQTLGIDKKASKEDIKKAFRKLAHKYHPDKKTGDESKFKEINEAYSVLSDDKKRGEYDSYGRTFDGGAPGSGQGFGGFDFSGFQNAAGGQDFDLGDIMSEFFSERRGNRQARGRDISMDTEISFEEGVFGVERSVLLNKASACEHCTGSGAEPGSDTTTCETCNGKGQVHEVKQTLVGNFSTSRTCDECTGRGTVPTTKCKDCAGIGVKQVQQEIKINIPSGVNTGEMIRLTGAGEAVPNGQAGDLYIKVHVGTHKDFKKEGSNLIMDLKVKLTDALLGNSYNVKTLDGDLRVKIPAGVSHGEMLRVRGKGVPSNGRSRGDLLIKISIEIPKKLSRNAKKAIQDLKEEGI